MESFKVGEQVVHKSGGPVWVVNEVRESEIICERVDNTGQVHKQAFLAAVLVKYAPPRQMKVLSDPRRGW